MKTIRTLSLCGLLAASSVCLPTAQAQTAGTPANAVPVHPAAVPGSAAAQPTQPGNYSPPNPNQTPNPNPNITPTPANPSIGPTSSNPSLTPNSTNPNITPHSANPNINPNPPGTGASTTNGR